jgi:hypothetical protein
MSPNGQARGRKVLVPSNIYTVFLTIALFVVLATAAFVAYTCYVQYGTIFKIP